MKAEAASAIVSRCDQDKEGETGSGSSIPREARPFAAGRWGRNRGLSEFSLELTILTVRRCGQFQEDVRRVEQPLRVSSQTPTEFVVERDDKSGRGANFVVEWSAGRSSKQ